MLETSHNKIIECKLCPRLSKYIENVGQTKVKRFYNEKYWSKPVHGYGDFNASIIIIGLAPAAHGGNRTVRYLQKIVLVIGLPKLFMLQDLQVNLLAYQKMMGIL